MDCLSLLGTPSHLCQSAPWDGAGSVVGWPNKLILLERGFLRYLISGLSLEFAMHPSYSRGCQHCTLTPKPDPGLPVSWEKLKFPSQNGHFLVFAAEQGGHFQSPLLLPVLFEPFFPQTKLIEVTLLLGDPEITPKVQRKISWKGFQRPPRNDPASYSKFLPFLFLMTILIWTP